LIGVEGLRAGYVRGIDVLQGIDLEAPRSRVTSVIGPNGSGKSTLLKAICGFVKPTAGRVLYDGREITGEKPYRLLGMGLAYLTQERELFPQMTVEENLMLGAWLFRHDRGRVQDALRAVYEHYPFLRARRHVKAGALSGGEQRMLELGRLLMCNPRVLLLDEPTAGLAPKVAREVYSEIARLKAMDLTVLLVDQNIRAAVELADKIYVLENGRVVVEGDRGELAARAPELVRGWLRQTSG
jgi:branched-chain amino acid transport system ATP-binding protein